jgi:hypothetical protein
LKNIPEELLITPIDDTEFITDEDEKIRCLLENNKITIKEYNKIMKSKHRSQLNITDLSNISDLNISTNFLEEQKNEQTVLFGKDFIDTTNQNSDTSMLKIKKPIEDPQDDKKPSVEKPAFSMLQQIAEFKKQLEKEHSIKLDENQERIQTEPSTNKVPLLLLPTYKGKYISNFRCKVF